MRFQHRNFGLKRFFILQSKLEKRNGCEPIKKSVMNEMKRGLENELFGSCWSLPTLLEKRYFLLSRISICSWLIFQVKNRMLGAFGMR